MRNSVPVDPDRNIGFQLRITSEVLRSAMQEKFSPLGVRLAHWQYLRVLWKADGITQKELSKRARRVGANAVSVLNDLERMGLVKRVRNRTDRRVSNVRLTDAGKAMKHALVPIAAGIHDRALTGFRRDEVQTLFSFLRRMRANLNDYGD